MKTEWKNVDALAENLAKEFGQAPSAMVVLGSGLSDLVDSLQDETSISTANMENWPNSTVKGHAGAVHKGKLGQTQVLLQQGRVHLYEGYSPAEVVRPIRAALTWGVQSIILTNAAGGIDPDFNPGDIMLIADHLNLTGKNPLIGPNDDRRGERFPDLTALYDSHLSLQLETIATEAEIQLRKGIYAGLLGPTYETPAEVRMLRALGAQAVGMSTVLEAIATRHMNKRVIGLSCITNKAAGMDGAVLNHDDVQKAGRNAADHMSHLVTGLVNRS